jgi:hypothetical protein
LPTPRGYHKGSNDEHKIKKNGGTNGQPVLRCASKGEISIKSFRNVSLRVSLAVVYGAAQGSSMERRKARLWSGARLVYGAAQGSSMERRTKARLLCDAALQTPGISGVAMIGLTLTTGFRLCCFSIGWSFPTVVTITMEEAIHGSALTPPRFSPGPVRVHLANLTTHPRHYDYASRYVLPVPSLAL